MPDETSLQEAVEASHKVRLQQGREETLWEKGDFLQFSLGNELYAFETKEIQEIIPSPKITHVPTAPEYVLGVFHNRGVIVPAIDLGGLLGLSHTTPLASGVRCVIIQAGKDAVAFIPDSIIGVMGLPVRAVESPLPAPSVEAGFVKGQIRLKDKIVVILDARAILEGSKIKAVR